VWWVGRQGLQVDLRGLPPGAPVPPPPARGDMPGAGAYALALGWAAPYALAVGAACTAVARALTLPGPGRPGAPPA